MSEIIEVIPEAPHPQANTVKVALRGYQNGSEVINTFFFKYIAGVHPTTQQMLDLGAAFWSHIAQEYKAWCTDRWRISDLTMTDLGALPQTGAVYVPPAGNGTNGTNPMPGNSSLGVRRTTAGKGKSYHGRVMLPPPDKGAFVNDLMVGTWITHALNLASLLLDAYPYFGGNVFRPAVGSNKLVGSTAIVSWVFDLVADSMKTRLLTHGT